MRTYDLAAATGIAVSVVLSVLVWLAIGCVAIWLIDEMIRSTVG